MSEKEKLREIARKNRQEADAADDGMAARRVAAQVIMLPELDHLKSVAGYYSIKDELDCIVTLKALHAARFELSLPTIVSSDAPLEFRSWDLKSALSDGPFGTKEASGDTVTPNVVLVPLLAFDENGSRLGYGGGYYDRSIEKLRQENPDLVTIGIAYENQKLARITVDSYDQPMDMVVTEKTTYRFN